VGRAFVGDQVSSKCRRRFPLDSIVCLDILTPISRLCFRGSYETIAILIASAAIVIGAGRLLSTFRDRHFQPPPRQVIPARRQRLPRRRSFQRQRHPLPCRHSLPATTLASVTDIPAPNATPSLEPAGAGGVPHPAPTPTVTPPAPNPAYPLLTARIQAIQIGGRRREPRGRASIRSSQTLVDKANEIFAARVVRLLYRSCPGFRGVQADAAQQHDRRRGRELGQRGGGWKSGGSSIPGQGHGAFIHGPGQAATGGGLFVPLITICRDARL